MGCTSSKVDSEDTVRRCKERRRFMKEAVHSRHHLAAAHSDYLRSLRQTGSALSLFASFQSLSVSPDLTAPVLLHHSDSLSSSVAAAATTPPFLPPTPPAPPPPPLSHHFSPIPPSPTIASSKLPHILSDSSAPSTPTRASFRQNDKNQQQRNTTKKKKKGEKPSYQHSVKYPHLPTNSTYATTPSQASSAWDWQNFYPPSPPDSDFFDRLGCREEDGDGDGDGADRRNHHHEPDNDDDRHHHLPEEEDEDEEGEKGQREEVQCRDWGDQYSTTSSSTKSDLRGGDEEDDSKSDGISAARLGFGSSSVDHRHNHLGRAPPSEFGSSSVGAKSGRKGVASSLSSEEVGSSSIGREDASSASNHLKMVVRHRDLKEIVMAIEEYFVRAAAAGEAVSDLLETGRAQFDPSFRQLRKTAYHSSSVLSNLSATWSSKPPLTIRYRLDVAALEDSADGGGKSHCSTLERLLAWEKKLYEEVKAREGVKIEHEKRLSSLQRQERKGMVDAKLDKIKASIAKYQSLILVTSQAVSTTSSAIIKVRDNELAPQLVDLCYGFMSMWRSMNQLHEVQNHIVQQVRGLVNHSTAIESTSDLHRQATRDLEAAISAWQSSFSRLTKYQRDYVRSLYSWLKLTLIQVSNDNAEKDHYSSLVSSELSAFCDEWKQALERLPDTVAAEAIKSFVNVVHTVSVKQTEELKIKKRTESYSKELEKKTLALRSIENKFYQSYSMVGIGLPDGRTDSNGQVFDMRDPLVEKKAKIAACRKKVEEEMARHTMAIKVTREMTLNNIQTGLPGVFQAMTGFSGLFAEALEGVCR